MSGPTYDNFEFLRSQFGLNSHAAAQVQNLINVRLLAEIVEQQGGEVFLPPGFNERAGRGDLMIATRFLDDGRYRIWSMPIEDVYDKAGKGTRWERVEGGEKRGRVLSLYEVDSEGGPVERGGDGTVTLRKINPDGSDAGALLITVQASYLTRGVGGWRRWTPPQDLVETLGGQA